MRIFRALKSLVAKPEKKGAIKFTKRYGTLFRVLAVGVSPAGAYTVDLIKLKEWDGESFKPKGRKITVENLPDGIFVNGKKFCSEW